MTAPNNDEVLYAVEQRCRLDAGFRHHLGKAIRQRDENDLEFLIREAVHKVLGVGIEVTFDAIRYVSHRMDD